MQETTQNTEVRNGGKGWKIAGGIAIVALIGANFYLMNRVGAIESSTQIERDAMTAEVSNLEASLSEQTGAHQREISALQESVEKTKAEAADRARAETRRSADQLSKLIAQKEQEQQDMFLSEIGTVRGETDTNRKGLEDVMWALVNAKEFVLRR